LTKRDLDIRTLSEPSAISVVDSRCLKLVLQRSSWLLSYLVDVGMGIHCSASVVKNERHKCNMAKVIFLLVSPKIAM